MGKKLPHRAPSRPITLEVHYVTLSKEEDDERIERLTRKILRIVANPGKASGRNPPKTSATASDSAEDLFGNSFEKSLGI